MKVIGITTDENKIAEILGTANYHYVCESGRGGKYYACFLAGGVMNPTPDKVAELLPADIAYQIDRNAVKAIEAEGKRIQQMMDDAPVINMDLLKLRMERLLRNNKERIDQMFRQQPNYSN